MEITDREFRYVYNSILAELVRSSNESDFQRADELAQLLIKLKGFSLRSDAIASEYHLSSYECSYSLELVIPQESSLCS